MIVILTWRCYPCCIVDLCICMDSELDPVFRILAGRLIRVPTTQVLCSCSERRHQNPCGDGLHKLPGLLCAALTSVLFVCPCRHGPGSMMYGSGDVFEGMWAHDQKHGPGSYFYMSRGKRLDGVWQVGRHWVLLKCLARMKLHSTVQTPVLCYHPYDVLPAWQKA